MRHFIQKFRHRHTEEISTDEIVSVNYGRTHKTATGMVTSNVGKIIVVDGIEIPYGKINYLA